MKSKNRLEFEAAVPKERALSEGYREVFFTDTEYEAAYTGWKAGRRAGRKYQAKLVQELRNGIATVHSAAESLSGAKAGMEAVLKIGRGEDE